MAGSRSYLLQIAFVQRDVPIGGIVAWSGSIVSIPARFVLCNGLNGTPDLRDKFLVGAGSTYAVGASGGSVNHNHPFTGDGHFHTLLTAPVISAGTDYSAQLHTESITGTTDNTNGLAPYYSLAYIMYKGV